MLSRGQRCALAGGIAFAHLLAIWLLLAIGKLSITLRKAVPIEVSLSELASDVTSRPALSKAPIHGVPVQEAGGDRAGGRAASPTSLSTPGRTLIDWGSEASAAADDIVRDLVRGETRHCADSPKRDPWLPPCKRHFGRFEWSEEPKRAGFENGLPYIRLGKHCILSVGVLGCGFGSAEANGHLFDDMRDPDRDRSSVPDISEINEPVDTAPQRRSVVLKP
jgi:hypothetical protein